MTEREFELSHKSLSLESTPIFEPCPTCHVRQKYGTSPYCRECTSEYNKQYYAEHREEKLQWQRANKDKIRARQRKRKHELVTQKGGKCERCGYDQNYAALVFHHPNGRKGASKGSKGLLSSEDPQNSAFHIDEVVLVCENCHKEIHYPELQILKVAT